MQARIAPTSPANKKSDEMVRQVWADGQIQQPVKIPWGKLSWLIIILSLIFSIGSFVAYGWLTHRYPQSWLTRIVPSTLTTTTVIQPAKESVQFAVPSAVQQVLNSSLGIVRNQGQVGVYRQSDILGLTWPLSSSGWTISITGAWPTDVKSLAVLPLVGQTLAVTSTVVDPGTQFIFLKSTEISSQPISIGTSDDLKIGQLVWIVDGRSAVARYLIEKVEPRWASSDRDESYWRLDSPVTMSIGSAVVLRDGTVIGLLGGEGRVWAMSSVTSVVKQVIQQSNISRPSIGLRVLNQATARINGQPTASGFEIGSDQGETAVTAKGPADKAGLKSGDIIMAIDDRVPAGDIFSILNTYKPGDIVTMSYRRQQKTKTASITIGSTRP